MLTLETIICFQPWIHTIQSFCHLVERAHCKVPLCEKSSLFNKKRSTLTLSSHDIPWHFFGNTMLWGHEKHFWLAFDKRVVAGASPFSLPFLCRVHKWFWMHSKALCAVISVVFLLWFHRCLLGLFAPFLQVFAFPPLLKDLVQSPVNIMSDNRSTCAGLYSCVETFAHTVGSQWWSFKNRFCQTFLLD